ncbi:hypothetical protein FGO68_gene7136 [Halteria grandinella]|uniref:Uncharacterized protein n=1 Tax=Halteria grandinella TaxID=5974 RepID=A0A8J8NYZ1_HALGN|nr:hypothetical protein FGO68_gene7136 [Halteria grandinella]
MTDALIIFQAVVNVFSWFVLLIAPYIPYIGAALLITVLVLIYIGVLPNGWDDPPATKIFSKVGELLWNADMVEQLVYAI